MPLPQDGLASAAVLLVRPSYPIDAPKAKTQGNAFKSKTKRNLRSQERPYDMYILDCRDVALMTFAVIYTRGDRELAHQEIGESPRDDECIDAINVDGMAQSQ
jgi:hypothetical protein